MIPEKLKQIDESIIQLLSDRLSILAESGVPNIEEQLSYVAPLLAQLGVPEHVWTNNATMSSLAALTAQAQNNQNKHNHNHTSRKITIIGGRGRMGQFFTQHLSAAGHQVSAFGSQDWENADILAEADLVLVSVPIEHTVDTIKRAAKYIAPTTALADITSIKAEPVEAMLEQHSGSVMGLHPMFGPSVQSFSGQKVVVCSGRNDEEFQWLLDFMHSQGALLISCTPQEHDSMMVIVQATQHFSRFSFGVFLSTESFDVERSLSMSSPSYRQEIEIVNRLFAQNPTLCVDIMLATEERCQTIERLANTYSRLAQLVVNKDREGLIQEFVAAQSFFGKETSHLKSSNYTKCESVTLPLEAAKK